MFSVRNIGGVSLFLFGTTFLWLTPAFVTKGLSTAGGLWSIVHWVSLVIMGGFTLATWGLFRRAEWWEPVAIGSAILGFVVLIPYWIAAHRTGEPSLGINIFVHALGGVGVLVLLLVPSLQRWVYGHVMAGR